MLEIFFIVSLAVLYGLIFSTLNLDLVMSLILLICILTVPFFVIITFVQFYLGRDKVLDEYILKLNLMYYISRL